MIRSQDDSENPKEDVVVMVGDLKFANELAKEVVEFSNVADALSFLKKGASSGVSWIIIQYEIIDFQSFMKTLYTLQKNELCSLSLHNDYPQGD